jgi:hypothetical protein
MTSILSTIPTEQTASPGPSVGLTVPAGQFPSAHSGLTDAEREIHIRDCGRLMTNAFERGNREEAMGWLQAQNDAIKGRSPAQVARMEGCYFCDRGEADKQAMGVINA